MFSWMIKRNQPHEFVLISFENTDDVSHQHFLFDYLSMLAKTTCFCSNLLWNIMLLQVLISDLISILASVFFHSWKTFCLLTCAIRIPCHTHAEVDFESI